MEGCQRAVTEEPGDQPHCQHKPVQYEGFEYFQELIQSIYPDDAMDLLMNPDMDNLLTLVTEQMSAEKCLKAFGETVHLLLRRSWNNWCTVMSCIARIQDHSHEKRKEQLFNISCSSSKNDVVKSRPGHAPMAGDSEYTR